MNYSIASVPRSPPRLCKHVNAFIFPQTAGKSWTSLDEQPRCWWCCYIATNIFVSSSIHIVLAKGCTLRHVTWTRLSYLKSTSPSSEEPIQRTAKGSLVPVRRSETSKFLPSSTLTVTLVRFIIGSARTPTREAEKRNTVNIAAERGNSENSDSRHRSATCIAQSRSKPTCRVSQRRAKVVVREIGRGEGGLVTTAFFSSESIDTRGNPARAERRQAFVHSAIWVDALRR